MLIKKKGWKKERMKGRNSFPSANKMSSHGSALAHSEGTKFMKLL